jgi:hypothetical protein
MTATLSAIAQVGPDDKPESCDSGPGPDPAIRRGASLAERGYRYARFGGVPVLVGPELAAQLNAIRRRQP